MSGMDCREIGRMGSPGKRLKDFTGDIAVIFERTLMEHIHLYKSKPEVLSAYAL